jgi:hypothetical protein
LFENGVIVPMRGSVAEQCMMASSHPALTIVSELSRITSARDSCMPRFAVPVKPRFLSLRSTTTCGCARAPSSSKSGAIEGSGDASSMTTTRTSGRRCASTLATQCAHRPARCTPG